MGAVFQSRTEVELCVSNQDQYLTCRRLEIYFSVDVLGKWTIDNFKKTKVTASEPWIGHRRKNQTLCSTFERTTKIVPRTRTRWVQRHWLTWVPVRVVQKVRFKCTAVRLDCSVRVERCFAVSPTYHSQPGTKAWCKFSRQRNKTVGQKKWRKAFKSHFRENLRYLLAKYVQNWHLSIKTKMFSVT